MPPDQEGLSRPSARRGATGASTNRTARVRQRAPRRRAQLQAGVRQASSRAGGSTIGSRASPAAALRRQSAAGYRYASQGRDDVVFLHRHLCVHRADARRPRYGRSLGEHRPKRSLTRRRLRQTLAGPPSGTTAARCRFPLSGTMGRPEDLFGGYFDSAMRTPLSPVSTTSANGDMRWSGRTSEFDGLPS